MNIESYKSYLFKTIYDIFSIDSPSGYYKNIMPKIKEYADNLGFKFETIQKGCGIITVDGKDNDKTVMLSAHVDTLGLMVRSISSDGTIKFTKVGGPIMPTLDGEYCKIITRDEKVYTGTIISDSPAIHVHPNATTETRDEDHMHIRIDEIVKSKEDVLALGINTGDYIAIDPKTIITPSEFLKSRFIDDKASVCCLLTLLKIIKDNTIIPKHKTKIFFSVYEEVGHGASYIPEDVSEVLAVDMGCIGLDLNCTEYDVSICAKDSNGPYDYDLTTKLINLSKQNNLDYAVDIYPRYGSDVGACLSGGNDVKGALIGPGVHASHGMERTHYKALENTIKLLIAYLQ